MSREDTLRDLARLRWRMALIVSAVVVVIYFGFILLIAFNKPLMGALVVPGLSWGILAGALVIVLAWVTTWIYVRWANRHVDAVLAGLKE